MHSKKALVLKQVMDAEHLLKIPQSESDEHIVVNVKKNGPGPLDLRLVATDGSDVYVSKSRKPPTAWPASG